MRHLRGAGVGQRGSRIMPLTGAQRQAQYIAKRNATFKRYEAALEAIAGGATMPSQTARNALNGDTSHE